MSGVNASLTTGRWRVTLMKPCSNRGLPPNLLELEITEGTTILNLQHTLDNG